MPEENDLSHDTPEMNTIVMQMNEIIKLNGEILDLEKEIKMYQSLAEKKAFLELARRLKNRKK